MVLTLDPAPNAPSYSNPDTFEPDTSNYLAWMKVIRDQLSGIALEVGDFGLGGISPVIGNASVTDNSIAPGFYTYDPSVGSTGGPIADGRGLMIHQRRTSGGGETQIFIMENASGITAGRVYTRARVAGSWFAWQEGLLASDKTQSSVDSTAGRLLKVGDFGLGGVAPTIGNASVTDNSIAPGTYGYEEAKGSSGGPISSNGLLTHGRRASGGGETQMYIRDAAPEVYIRSRTTAGWSAWLRVDTASGSNTNGDWVRLSDGTQICTFIMAGSTSGAATWTFPAVFSSMGNSGVSMIPTIAAPRSPTLEAISTTSLSFSVFAPDGTRSGTNVRMTAISRWK